MEKTIVMTRNDLLEMIKCANDPIYFIEKYVKVNNLITGDCSLKLRDEQRKRINQIYKSKYTVYYDARQTGKTTIALAYIIWHACFNNEQNIMIAGYRGDRTRELLSLVKEMIYKLPKFLIPNTNSVNKNQILFDNGSVINVYINENSIRGSYCDVFYIDEAAFISNLDEILTNIVPALSGVNGKLIMSSTPNMNNEIFMRYTS